jgi:hypothetical protein
VKHQALGVCTQCGSKYLFQAFEIAFYIYKIGFKEFLSIAMQN